MTRFALPERLGLEPARLAAAREGLAPFAWRLFAPRRVGRAVRRRDDRDAAVVLAVGIGAALDCLGKAVGDGERDVEQGLARPDPDRADLMLGHMAAAAEQRQDPARVGILAAADVEPEPEDRKSTRSELQSLMRISYAVF